MFTKMEDSFDNRPKPAKYKFKNLYETNQLESLKCSEDAFGRACKL